ncbi:RidA family protein [Nakamurella lactea]|uniref:RidA family protein n=1 Tax=Nakamurella lactea TaxID=459515 RepID=UPI000413B8D8|nr:RidA family protein [Nakamurella lactea]
MPAIESPDIPAPGVPLSAGYRAGDLLFVSGQIASNGDGSVLIGDFEDEVNKTLDNVEAILKAGGADFSNVVKVNAWLSNSLLFAKFNEIYRQRFAAATDVPPARTTMVVAFGHADVRVEVDAIAYLGE